MSTTQIEARLRQLGPAIVTAFYEPPPMVEVIHMTGNGLVPNETYDCARSARIDMSRRGFMPCEYIIREVRS
jgi:hypothetical protein